MAHFCGFGGMLIAHLAKGQTRETAQFSHFRDGE
jgi:hypothetical protein